MDPHVLGKDGASAFIRKRKSDFEGKYEKIPLSEYEFGTELVAALIKPNRVDVSKPSPKDFRCNDMNEFSYLVLSRDPSSPSNFYVYLLQHEKSKSDEAEDPKSRKSTGDKPGTVSWADYVRESRRYPHLLTYRFQMEKDFFSPGQSESALAFAGGVVEALLKVAPQLLKIIAR